MAVQTKNCGRHETFEKEMHLFKFLGGFGRKSSEMDGDSQKSNIGGVAQASPGGRHSAAAAERGPTQ